MRPMASGAPSPSQASEIYPEHAQGSRGVTAAQGEMMKYLFYFHLYIQILNFLESWNPEILSLGCWKDPAISVPLPVCIL